MKKNLSLISFLILFSLLSKAQVSGIVYRDFNTSGIKENTGTYNEPGVTGITVTATLANGTSYTATTDASGAYSFTAIQVPSGTAVRIEFTATMPSSVQGTSNGTSVQFVTGGTSNVDYAMNNPDDYWDNTGNPIPDVLVVHQSRGTLTNPENSGKKALLQTNNAASGPNNPSNSTQMTIDTSKRPSLHVEVGSTFALSYHARQERFFQAAYMKRMSAFGPKGTGGLYIMSKGAGSVYDLASSFDLNGVTPLNGGSALDFGSVTRTTSPGTGAAQANYISINSQWSLPSGTGSDGRDNDAFFKVGLMSIGGVDVDRCYDTMYLINMFQKSLVVMDISGTTSSLNNATAAALGSLVKSYDLASLSGYPSAVGAGNNIRPFAVKIYGGKGYLGVVSDAMSTQSLNDLKGYILQFDPHNISAGFTNILTINFNAYSDVFWHPWISTWAQAGGTNSSGPISFPQPMISDIEFNEDGSMDIGIRDRWGDQGAAFEFWPVPTPSTTANHDQTVGQGDVLHVCNVSGTWAIEGTSGSCTQLLSNGSAGNNPVGSMSSYGNTGKEFYGDHAGDDNAEDGFGGLAKIMGTKMILSTCLDPIINGATQGSNYWSTSGLKWNDNTSGIVSQIARTLGGDFNSLDKANSLGDLEFVQPCPKMQIGNRLWVDANSDGIQDAGESPIPSATVELVAPGTDGTFGTLDDIVVASTTTGTDGSYYFSTLTTADTRKPAAWTGVGTNDILPGYDYQIRVPLSQSAITTNNYAIGTSNVNSNGSDLIDSDGDPLTANGSNYSAVVFNTSITNHNFDFGFDAPPACVKPDAGSDQPSVCSGTSATLTGTTPTTGTWSALSSNPAGATLGSTTAGIATVAFSFSALGTYGFTYNIGGSCEDTMNITVTSCTSCACPGNILLSPSFETGSPFTNWTVATNDPSGNILSGNDPTYAVCGTNYGFIRSLNADAFYASVYQNITATPGATYNFSGYGGTHDPTQDQQFKLEFYDASNTLLSGGQIVQVDNDVDVAPFTLSPYTLSGVAPTGTAFVRITMYTQGVYIGENMFLKFDGFCLTENLPTCTKPDAGSDLVATTASTITLTGTAPTTGIWTAIGTNPSGASLSTTTAGVASVTFGTTVGLYKFIYADGACEDTMFVFVHNCDFTPSILTSSCHSNGTDNVATDDYITFQLKPNADSSLGGIKYTITATQGGNPVGVTLSDGTPATNLYFGYDDAFKTAIGTAGQGNITLTLTASNGCSTTSTVILTDPGTCNTTTPACSTGTVTYTYRTPFQYTDLNMVPLDLPKFDDLGGTRTLTQAALSYTIGYGTNIVSENSAVNPQTATITSIGDGLIDFGSSNLLSATFPQISSGTQSYPASVLVPAGTNGSAWPGDSVFTTGGPKTLSRSLILGLNDYLQSIYVNPTQSQYWVNNITGLSTTDADMKFLTGSATANGSTTYNTPSGLAPFMGTGLVAGLSASTLLGLSTSGGGGNVLVAQSTKAYATATVTYSYSTACTPTISLVNAATSACNGSTNQYDVTGTVTFSNPPTTGVLKISVPGEGFQHLYPPFTSPVSYTIAGLNADGLSKTVVATFSIDTTATNSTTYTAPTMCIPDPCGVTGAMGIDTYTDSIPLQTTNWVLPLTIPQFDDQGGTKILSKVLVSVKQSIRNVGVIESLDADTSTVNIMTTGTTRIKLGTDTIITNVLAAENISQFVQAGITVPAQGTWPGDLLGSTTLAMATMINNALNNGLDPRLDPTWVTTATGDPSTDDDIAVFAPRISEFTNNYIFTSPADLAKFIGTANLDLTANAKGASSVSGPGNANSSIKTKASADVTVTYIYCQPSCVPPLAGSDMTACGSSCVNLTGTSPTTGTWSEQSGNPIGATLGTTTSGIAEVCFTSTASGTFNFIYSTGGSCSDTMSVVVTPKPEAGPDQTTCLLNGNGTATLAATGTGTWTEQSGNPGTSTITTSTSATTTVTSFSAAGTYNYIWTNNGCTDTVSVVVTPSGSIGNLVWNDLNGNGLNDEATTDGINGITVELWKETAPASGIYALETSTTTANDGSSNPGYYNFAICESANYKVKFPTTNAGSNLTTQTTTTATDNNSDASPVDGFSPVTAIDVNGAGTAKDNPTIDAAYHACGSLGNYVWNDLNGNGLNDEATTDGINGISVELWKETAPASGIYALETSTTTANDGSSNPGYYNFTICESANYKVKFPTTNAGSNLTTQTTTTATDNNSDASPVDGFSPVTAIDVNGAGTAKDNPTIDAAYLAPILNTIGNYVWLDNNQDGIQDAAEPGVANIPVSLFLNGTDGFPSTTDDILVASTSTDAYGAYLFTNLPDGDYNVGFTLPSNYEFTSTTGSSDTDPANSDANITTGRTSTANLVGGETELDMDAGIIFSTPPALSSLGDYVWYDTNGDGVQDANESPIAGVTVTLCDPATGNVLAITTTNSNGEYLFNDLPNADYQVGFSPKPGTIFTQNNGGTTPGNTTTNSDANPITGKTGTVSITAAGTVITGLDAGFKDDPKASLGDLVWIDLNQDGLQDAGEPGVSNVTMTLYTVGPDGAIGGSDDILVATTSTDVNGNYLFSNLDPAKYFVTATPVAGYTISIQDAGNDDLKDNDFGSNPAYAGVNTTSQIYNLLAGQNYPGVDMGIYNSTPGLGSLGDKVWFDLDGNGVQDPTEYGIGGVTVCLLDGTGATVNNPATGDPYILQTDPNGNYLFTDLSAGNYEVAFKNIPEGTSFSPTGAGTTATDSDPNPSTGVTGVIMLGAGQNITDVDAGIVPGIPSGKGSLGNLVWIDANNDGIQDAGEQGVPGVTVNLYEDTNGDGAINGAEATTPVATQTTDAQGFYMFTGLDAGTYQVGFETSTLPSGYSLQTGKNDQGTNDAIDSDPNTTSGLTGLYNLAQGEDNLTVDAGIYNSTATNSVGDKVWLDQNADGLQTLGEPGVPGVAVSLLDASGEVIATTITDANGNYHFGNLPNGTYSVQVAPPAGFNVTTQNSGVDDTVDSDIDPTTGTTASVSLIGGTNITDLDAGLTTTRAALGNYVWLDTNTDGIQDPGELGVPGVTVLLTRPGFGPDGIAGNADDSEPVASAITDGNGLYFFSNLEPGTYDVQFTTIPSGLSYTTQNVTTPNDAGDSDADPISGMISVITLTAGQVDPTNDAGLIPLELGSVGDIAWFDVNQDGIRDLGEAPVPGTTVTLKNTQGMVIGTAITDGTGHFLFTNVPAGTGYTLTFANLPTGSTITAQGVGPTSTNSDADPTTGVTAPFVVVGGAKTPNIDAGVTLYIPLPVELENFAISNTDCKVSLSWMTTSEANVANFTIMRKASNEPSFTAIATLKAAGNSNTIQHYGYKEGSLSNGNYAYYINTSDIDGKQYATDIKSITLDCRSNSISVFPNPATDQINIRFNSIEYAEYSIRVIDMTGKVIMTTSTIAEPGTKVLVIPVSTYAQGIYHVSISSESGTETFNVNIGK